jgi:hypothetical protein
MHQAAPPAALEEHLEVRPRRPSDPPRLLGHDRAQQVVGERAVAGRDEIVEAREQRCLVGAGPRRSARARRRPQLAS